MADDQAVGDKPEAVIVVPDIVDVQDNYGGNNNAFLIKLPQESVHMKCDEAADKDRWVAALKTCRHKFAKEKSSGDDRKNHKDELDPRILQIIVAEQESSLLLSSGESSRHTEDSGLFQGS